LVLRPGENAKKERGKRKREREQEEEERGGVDCGAN